MRKQDKKKNMDKVNKKFQDRMNGVDEEKDKEKDKFKFVKDIYPELSRIIN
jgi:hypothetical protein